MRADDVGAVLARVVGIFEHPGLAVGEMLPERQVGVARAYRRLRGYGSRRARKQRERGQCTVDNLGLHVVFIENLLWFVLQIYSETEWNGNKLV